MRNITINFIAAIVLGVTIYLAALFEQRRQMKNAPEQVHVAVDTSTLRYKSIAYVPVNVPAEVRRKKKTVNLVLKIRNTSFSDSLYVSKVDYYDREGALISKVLDSGRLVMPMATGVFSLQNGKPEQLIDNFIVEWRSGNPVQPLIQVVGTNGQDVSLLNERGILIEDNIVY